MTEIFYHIDNKSELFVDVAAIALAFSRFVEPFVLNIFMNDLKKWLPCFYKKFYSSKLTENSLSTFANSAMNIEYVYLIICGVTELFSIE